MKTYNDMISAIVKFMDDEHIDAYDMHRLVKDLCCCKTCKYYVQHYNADGKPVDFGHCVKSQILKAVKPNTNRCGSWTGDEE